MEVNTEELIREVRRIRILTRRLLDERLSGDYHSVFKGQGIEFDEARPYQPGDDVRAIDWNVTARTGEPFVKRFSEERELTVLFMVDVSGSQSFGTQGRSKAARAAELTALLAMTAMDNHDKVGLVLFSNRVIQFIPPRKGRTAVQRLVREVLAAEGEAVGGTDVAGAIRFLNGVQKRKCVVFLVSDFQDAGYEKLLRVVARRHDVVCVSVSDPAERQLPDAGLAELEDPETGELVLVDTSDRSVRAAFAEKAAQEEEELLRFFNRSGIDHVELATDKPYINAVRALFQRRARKR
jgi:uncharacterized protein (DUF58 family)